MSNDFNMPPVPPNPYGSPMGGGMSPNMPNLGGIDARDKVKLPAIFLMICGALGILLCLYYIFSTVLVILNPEMLDAQLDAQLAANPNMDPQGIEMMRTWAQYAVYGQLVWAIMGLFVQAVIIMGGVSLMRLSSQGMAKTGSILACIPCVCASCGILSIPFGIWALVTMGDANVKAAFSQSRR